MSFNPALLKALAPGELVSGAALARELGISRTAVWKGMRRLKALGIEVNARARRGYCLVEPLELLDEAKLRQSLPERVRSQLARLELLAVTDSTNSRVLAGNQALGLLTACLAEYQSAGRGRRGRRWLAAPGQAVCLSVGGRMPAALADFATLSTVVGLRCALALERLGVTGVKLKWPNDLLLGTGKLGGILIELRGEAQGPVTVVIGVGINLRLGTAVSREILETGGVPPAALLDQLPDVSRNELAGALIVAAVEALESSPDGLDETALAAWVARDALLGQWVRTEARGKQEIGIARGIDATGALLLEVSPGVVHRITAGEVTLRVLA